MWKQIEQKYGKDVIILGFQKDLIVWKLMSDEGGNIPPDIVSEGLNSVET